MVDGNEQLFHLSIQWDYRQRLSAISTFFNLALLAFPVKAVAKLSIAKGHAMEIYNCLGQLRQICIAI